MTHRVVVRRLARGDIDRACDYYETERAGLGRRFAEFVDQAIDRIADNPLQYSAVHRRMRRTLLHPFPYAIFFRVHAGTVRVYAVMHTSRHPAR